MTFRIPILLALLLPSLQAEEISFNRDIRPIFSKTCFECHGFDPNTRKAKLRLDDRAAAIADRDGSQAIVPGNAEDSLVYELISLDDPEEKMPPKDFHTQLSKRDIELIKTWINQGAKYETHWSFIPPKQAQVPEGKSAIDHFVRQKLTTQKMAPSNRADRATLIRRASLDLTGLPATPKEVADFVNDTSDHGTAWSKVVDRLLASPRFGEHRTRFWLDAARYADTSGYQYDRIRHQWVWRDWVINAFNTNMPFDQFTIEQMAGDLLPNATPQTRLATGFHRNHPITIEGGIIDEEYRTEYVMDRVTTTTTTWMGLTFLCARCHDHKYDPISQDDFYSFYSFFNNVPERGMNGFNPKLRIPSPIQPTNLDALNQAVAQAETAKRTELNRLRPSFATWEAKLRDAVKMNLVDPEKLEAGGGTKLTKQPDGSILATGPNPGTQTYKIEFTVKDKPIQAIQLEALTHPSHVNKSTGRGSNGNFVLSEVKIEAGNKPIKISSASADYEQPKYPITAAIDGKTGKQGWAVDGNTKFEDRSATFTLAKPQAPGTKIRVSLIHTWGGSHSIGRFRLSVPEDGRMPVPKGIRDTVALPEAKRKPAAKAALANFLAAQFGGATYKKLESDLIDAKAQRDRATTKVPETMILTEMPKPRTTYVLMRGEYDKPIKEREVKANTPTILGAMGDLPRNRLGLAKWLVSRQNPLTARVTVNRFWAQLFGTGLVKTVEDFGSQGEYPSHPDLLDWLAVDFMESGWDTKNLFRTILTSDTYCQSSNLTPEALSKDPANRLLARGPRYRLDAESIRDSALAVSGLLDATIGGPSVYPYHPKGLWLEINNRPGYSRAYPHTDDTTALYRRSMYTFWKRTVPPPSMAAFDAPEREFCMVQRSRTNTPLQAFVLLHDPQFVEAARKLAERILLEAPQSDATTRIHFAFQLTLGRSPNPKEAKLLSTALESHLTESKSNPGTTKTLLAVGKSPVSDKIDPTELAAWTSVSRIILNLSEFITRP